MTTYYNEPPPGPPRNLNLRLPFPQLGFIQLVNASSHSSYNALQLRLQQRFTHARAFRMGLRFQW